MSVLKFVNFAHSQSEEINRTLREFTHKILVEEKTLVDAGFWDKNGEYKLDLVWVENDIKNIK